MIKYNFKNATFVRSGFFGHKPDLKLCIRVLYFQIDTSLYLKYLTNRFIAAGGKLVQVCIQTLSTQLFYYMVYDLETLFLPESAFLIPIGTVGV